MQLNEPNKLTIHCSDSDIASHDDISVIEKWHLARGMDKVGYQYFIKNNGTIQKGREENEIGAHVKYYNRNNIGICISGKNIFTEEQKKSVIALVQHLVIKYNIPKERVFGHRDLDKTGKTCPNFEVKDEILRYIIWPTH